MNLRLMRSALNKPSRSPARISFLLSSSSTTFSATTERLLVFRLKRNAPEHIGDAFNGTDLLNTGLPPATHAHLRSLSCEAGADS